MEDAKRRAAIRNKAAKRKETDEGAMRTGSRGLRQRDHCLRETVLPRSSGFQQSPSLI